MKRPDDNILLYEAALRTQRSGLSLALWGAWTAIGQTALWWFCWREPFTARLFADALAHGWPYGLIHYGALPLVMAARAILLVESFGYLYHRFFQHLGWLTRQAQVFRRNQMFHWMHHMILYPIGRLYMRKGEYVASEKGIAWSWAVPGLMTGAAALWSMGANVGTAAFIAAIGLYAKFVIDVTHSRFHQTAHPWIDKRYFHWLEEIHILHHWDQRNNFTIIHPFMDALFGTYLSPATHARELAAAIDDNALTVSDLVNWRYLLVEASPAEYAAFISNAKRHPRSLRKLDKLEVVLDRRVDLYPNDATARLLQRRLRDLVAVVQPAATAS